MIGGRICEESSVNEKKNPATCRPLTHLESLVLKSEGGGWHVVDVMHSPATFYDDDSEKARSYKRLGRSNARPPQPRTEETSHPVSSTCVSSLWFRS